jgi:hypothetical protein
LTENPNTKVLLVEAGGDPDANQAVPTFFPFAINGGSVFKVMKNLKKNENMFINFFLSEIYFLTSQYFSEPSSNYSQAYKNNGTNCNCGRTL